MVNQPPSDAPFGLQPNVAAGLAYLLGPIGGIIMLVGGGTNRFVKWAAAQSIVMWVCFIVLEFALGFVIALTHMFMIGFIWPLLWLLSLFLWLWPAIMAFQNREVRVPVAADLTQNLFGSMLQ